MESISERQQRHFSTDIKFLEEKSSLQHTLVERKGDLCYQPRITKKEVAALNNQTMQKLAKTSTRTAACLLGNCFIQEKKMHVH